ncbi:sulfotransferase family protein [Microtetraspora malaysiensis]|uniref:sulfotransferase family protein n=1 Tax=Microtetraspora malaysiensis TaxID=161358 RepID=UPI003D8A52A3
MRPPTHILVVNGVKVHRPVFVLGAPHSGADLLARVLKRSAGFHVTMGRPAVARVVYAFARRPSIARSGGAPSVIRDALAEAWRIGPDACTGCPAACREASGVVEDGPCVRNRAPAVFGDAGPDLLYSAPVLLQAFPDARFVQVIRDGRDVVADMLADPACMTWFRPHMLSEDAEFPSAFLGVRSAEHRERWLKMPAAGKCALRWRAAVRLNATLRRELPREQLLTLRYEDVLAEPGEAVAATAEFLSAPLSSVALYGTAPSPVGVWRARLSATDLALAEKVAREELTRLGYL